MTHSTQLPNGCSELLLFGATGDLAKRMLLPSLYALHADRLIGPELRIFGTARAPMGDDEYRTFAKQALASHLANDRGDTQTIDGFLARLHYQSLDVSKPEGFAKLSERLNPAEKSIAIFLSTAPSLFEPTISGLGAAGLASGNVRIGLEKPLGNDLASSRSINDAVARAFDEDQIFRIDHYLGKETVQNLMALRFANMMFEPLWNGRAIEHIQITIAETVGLEDRMTFYDETGALRDMVQNHMLQLLALIAMEPPSDFNAAAVRDEKIKVLRSLRELAPEDSVTGQYGPGAVGQTGVAGYADELGDSSDTETYVALRAHIDNWRWKGVPFFLRTGKRMAERRSEIVVQFKPVPHSIFASRGGKLIANRLIIRLQPEEYVRLLVMAKEPGLDREGVTLREVPLDLSLSQAFSESQRRIAYERLLLDLIEGDQTLFVRRDEVEEQWAWVDAIRSGWQAENRKPKSYGAGSWGPSNSYSLAERYGVSWND